MGEHARLRPSCTCTSIVICCAPVGSVRPKHIVDRLSDRDAGFDDHLPDDGVRRFFQFDAEARDGSMTEDMMPMRHDMGDACVVEDRRLGAHHGKDAQEFLKVGHNHRPPGRIGRRSALGNDRWLLAGYKRR